MKPALSFLWSSLGMLLVLPLSSQYVVSGDATQESCNCYTLTQAQNTQVGSVWNENGVDLSNSFDFLFQVYLGTSEPGADGIAFGLQPLSTTIGNNGGGMGLGNVEPSLGVFIDTYQNFDNNNDPLADHLAINANGDVSHFGGVNDLAGPLDLPNMEDGAYHDLRIVWDALSMTLTATVDDVYVLTYTGDIVNDVFGGDPQVFWGFTGSTGGLNNEQGFCTQLDPVIFSSSTSVCPGSPVTFSDSSLVFGGSSTTLWDLGQGVTDSSASITQIFDSIGTYPISLTVSDASGCSALQQIVIDIVEPELELLADNTTICAGAPVILSATYAFPTPPCEYTIYLFDSWGDGWNSGSLEFIENGETIYSVTLADGEEGIQTITLSDNQPLEILFIPGDYPMEISFDIFGPDGTQWLNGDNFDQMEEVLFEGFADCPSFGEDVTLSWTPSNLISLSLDSLTASSNPLLTTEYTVTIDDQEGCMASESVLVEVSNMSHVDSTYSSLCDENDGAIGVWSSGGLGQYSYSLLDSGLVSSSGFFSGLVPGFYTVEIIDEAFCVDIIEVQVEEEPCALEVFIPNVFTPNGDSSNERFEIELSGGLSPALQIYNRWGQLVYETSDVRKGWNGKIEGTEAPEGTYYYSFKVQEARSQELHDYKGFLELLR